MVRNGLGRAIVDGSRSFLWDGRQYDLALDGGSSGVQLPVHVGKEHLELTGRGTVAMELHRRGRCRGFPFSAASCLRAP